MSSNQREQGEPSQLTPVEASLVEASLVESPAAESLAGGEISPIGDAPTSPRRGRPAIAWTVIIAVACLVIAAQLFARARETPGDNPTDDLGEALIELQGKWLVGSQSLLSATLDSEARRKQQQQIYAQMKQLDEGSLGQRLRFVALAGEIAGAAEAAERLAALEKEIKSDANLTPTEEQQQAIVHLRRMYADYKRKAWAAPSLSDSDRAQLRRQLGWFGDLALAPAAGLDKEAREAALAPAQSTMFSLLLVGGAMLAIGAAGVTGLITLVVLTFLGRIGSRIRAPSGAGGVYAETFAVWFVLHFVASIVISLAVEAPREEPTRGDPAGRVAALDNLPPTPINPPANAPATNGTSANTPPSATAPVIAPSAEASPPRNEEVNFAAVIAPFLLGLAALGWPVLRGVPWRQVRRDIGWYGGERPLLEPLWGVVGYVCTLPIVFAGLVLFSLIAWLARKLSGGTVGQAPPSHPVIEWVGDGGWAVILQLLLLASVCAPIIEETFFRGVLYRHLRDATHHWKLVGSVLFSSLFNGVLFAAIHPQGLLAIPLLAAIALGLSLQREWRGSLIAPIVAHGVNNAVALTVMFTFLT